MTKDVLAADDFVGTVTVVAAAHPVTLRASAGVDARLVFAPAVVNRAAYLALAQNSGQVGQSEEHFKFEGVSADGKKLEADIILSAHRHNSAGLEVTLASRWARLRLQMKEPVAHPILTRWMRGFQSFAGAETMTPLGGVVAFGAAEGVDKDAMSGGVQLVANAATTTPAWRMEAEPFLLHMQRGLALAHGGHLQSPFETYVEGDVQEVTFLSGGGFARELAVQPHLDLGPFVKALADRYFAQGPIPDIFWTALGWVHAETTIDDLRFLTGMIALEALVSSQLPKIKGGFAKRIEALIAHFGIAQVDFDRVTIQHMVDLRNDIVHEGEAKNTVDLWANIILVRELVARILLAQIGFTGRYWCYIGGHHLRHFPSCRL